MDLYTFMYLDTLVDMVEHSIVSLATHNSLNFFSYLCFDAGDSCQGGSSLLRWSGASEHSGVQRRSPDTGSQSSNYPIPKTDD